jgi:hypothetical protein
MAFFAVFKSWHSMISLRNLEHKSNSNLTNARLDASPRFFRLKLVATAKLSNTLAAFAKMAAVVAVSEFNQSIIRSPNKVRFIFLEVFQRDFDGIQIGAFGYCVLKLENQ